MSDVFRHSEAVHEGGSLTDSSPELFASLLHDALASTREDPFRAVCDAAIDRGLPPELVLVLLKRQWRRMPQARALCSVDSDHVLARHVTRCIKAYYLPRAPEFS